MQQRRLLVLSRGQTVGVQAVAPAFRSRGWDVDVSDMTTESLELVKKWPYDLVVMEVIQPGSEGFALCDTLRQRSRAPLLLIISSAARSDVIQGFRRGADAYVVEPFDMRELLVRAEALVRRAEGHVH
jgi:DNA-binding response OmpR family regulator